MRSGRAVGTAHAADRALDLAASRPSVSVEPHLTLPALGAVAAPVLVVAGAQDCFTGCRPGGRAGRHCSGGRAVVIDRCGHYPWWSSWRVRRAVDAFLGVGGQPAG